MDLGLKGKRFLVTGGSRGIGKACVEHLLGEGAKVAFSARGQEGIDAMLSAANAGDKLKGAAVDSADADAVSAWVKSVADDWSGLDGVISNTSAGGGVELGMEGWRTQVDTDLYGTVALVETALPIMIEGGGGAIVQIATITATEHHDFPGNPSYGAIKAGLVRYMGELAIRHNKDKIRANTVSPGPIWVEGGAWNWVKDNMPDHYARDIEVHPQKRMGTADEVASVVTFLSSDKAASWVTGQNINVDGAFTRGIDI